MGRSEQQQASRAAAGGRRWLGRFRSKRPARRRLTGSARSRRSPIGIDVGSRHFRAVQLHRTAPSWRLAAAATIPRSASGAAVEVAEAAQLRAQLAERGFRGQSIVLAVPGDRLMTGIMELPPRDSGAPIKELARRELSRMNGCDPGSFELACWDLPAPVRAAQTTFVMGAACRHEDANQLLDAFEQGGLHVEALDVRSLAIARACAAMLTGIEGIAGILDVGWCASQLVLLYRGAVVYERNLAKCAIGTLIEKLAVKLSLRVDAVEPIVIDRSCSIGPDVSPPAGEVQQACADTAAEHFGAAVDEMRIPLSYLSNQYPDAGLELLLLAGAGASALGLRQHLGQTLGAEVRVISPTALVDCAGMLDEECGSALAAATGLGQFEEP